MTRRFILFLAFCGLANLLLSACASAPKMIASFPSQDDPGEGVDPQLTYSATMTLEVWNQKTASKQSSSLVRYWGGYVKDVRLETLHGDSHTILKIVVPNQHFYDLRQDLLDLGTLVDERIFGDSSPSRANGDRDQYSYLTLTLIPGREVEISHVDPVWNPWRLFQKAWSLYIKIAHFMIKASLWVLVIAAPFLLVGYLAYRLGKRSNRN